MSAEVHWRNARVVFVAMELAIMMQVQQSMRIDDLQDHLRLRKIFWCHMTTVCLLSMCEPRVRGDDRR